MIDDFLPFIFMIAVTPIFSLTVWTVPNHHSIICMLHFTTLIWFVYWPVDQDGDRDQEDDVWNEDGCHDGWHGLISAEVSNDHPWVVCGVVTWECLPCLAMVGILLGKQVTHNVWRVAAALDIDEEGCVSDNILQLRCWVASVRVHLHCSLSWQGVTSVQHTHRSLRPVQLSPVLGLQVLDHGVLTPVNLRGVGHSDLVTLEELRSTSFPTTGPATVGQTIVNLLPVNIQSWCGLSLALPFWVRFMYLKSEMNITPD